MSHDTASRHRRPRWMRHVGTIVLMLTVFGSVHFWQTRHVNADIDPSMRVQWLTPDGQMHHGTLSDAILATRPSGQPLALYVWAHWCPICKAQQGTINSLAQDWPVLTVAMQSGDAAQVWRYQMQHELPWTTVIDPRSQLAQAQGFRSVPAFAVLDSGNRLRFPTVGYTSGWGMRARLWLARLR